MKQLLLLGAICLSCPALADTTPAALQPVTKIARVNKVEDLVTGKVTYRAEFCLYEDCDIFETSPAYAEELADFSYVFAASKGDEYELSLHATFDQEKLAEVLDRDGKKYGCAADKDRSKCTMHALFVAAKLKRYLLTEGDEDLFNEVGEAGE
jgi:hypothetical protein